MAAQRGEGTEQISHHYFALWRMLWRHFSAEEPWVLEWIQRPSETCGRANSIWIRYVWTGKFLNPERKSCGFKNIRTRVDGALENSPLFIMWILLLGENVFQDQIVFPSKQTSCSCLRSISLRSARNSPEVHYFYFRSSLFLAILYFLPAHLLV